MSWAMGLGRVEIEILRICDTGQLAALRGRLSGKTFDVLFVEAGTTSQDPTHTTGERRSANSRSGR